MLPGGERESELELSPNEIGRFVSGERSFGERWYVWEARVSLGSYTSCGERERERERETDEKTCSLIDRYIIQK